MSQHKSPINQNSTDTERRQFIKKMGVAGGAVAVAVVAGEAVAEVADEPKAENNNH